LSVTLFDLRLLQRRSGGVDGPSAAGLAALADGDLSNAHAMLDAGMLVHERSILATAWVSRLPARNVHRLYGPPPGRANSSFAEWRSRLTSEIAARVPAAAEATRIVVPAGSPREAEELWPARQVPVGVTVFAALEDRGDWRLEAIRDHRLPVASQRPTLALVTPLPPDHSGIADYAAELIGELEKHYRVELIHPDPASVAPEFRRLPVHSVEWFARHAGGYDRILYQFGNSDFHAHMFSLLERHPGAVTLHDAFLSGVISHMETFGIRPGLMSESLYRGHGYAAVAERWRKGRSGPDPVRKYPCSLSVIEPALRVIVHSHEARSILLDHYGPQIRSRLTLIPHLRAPLDGRSRSLARQELALDEATFLVVSFGSTSMTKLNHRLLTAWQASGLGNDPGCLLVFVGGGNDDYSERLQQQCIGLNARVTGRTSEATYRAFLMASDLAVQLREQSRGETSGAALDCMAAGLPVIVNDHGSLSEFPSPTVCRLDDRFADRDLVEALERLRADRAERSRLSAAAGEYLRAVHDPALAGVAYRDAIEAAYMSPASEVSSLAQRLAPALPPAPTEAMAEVAASYTVLSLPAPLQKREIFFDVTAIARNDAGSGIERTVRNLLTNLIEAPPAAFRVEPVRLDGGSLVLARDYACRLLGIREFPLRDESAHPRPGDIYFMADLDHSAVRRHRALYRALRLHGVKTAFMVHDLLPVRRPEFFPSHAAADHAAWLETVAEADLAVAVTRDVARDLSNWLAEHPGGGSPAIAFSHHGSDLRPPWSGNAPGLLDRYRTRKVAERPAFLIVGTVEPRKGHDDALDAFETLWAEGHDIQLVVAGRKGFRPLDVIDRMRRHREKGRRLFWFHNVTDGMLENLYRRSTCLLAPSRAEGFGLPLVEAALHGLPVLARDIPVFREIAPTGSRFFANEGAEALAHAVRDWLAHPVRKQRASGMLSWRESAANLASLLVDPDSAGGAHHGWVER
jgi:glycosyltransferase involved in cell wall biosynthesis